MTRSDLRSHFFTSSRCIRATPTPLSALLIVVLLGWAATGSAQGATPLLLGEIIPGALEETDAELYSGQYFDEYSFQGFQDQEILISLSSFDFDAFLWLLNSQGDVIAINDDSGDAMGAVIGKFTLPETGTYSIWAASYSDGETGDYVLSLNEAPPTLPAAELPVDQGITGQLTVSSPQFDSGEYYEVYSFEAFAGEALSIRMGSRDFDPHLWLLNSDGRVLTINDDSRRKAGPGRRPYGAARSRLRSRGRPKAEKSEIIFLPPVSGPYILLASSSGPGQQGGYSLVVLPHSIPVRPDRLGDGEPLTTGELGDGDFQLNTGQYLDVFRLSGEEGDHLTVALDSPDFDSYLRVLDRDGNVVSQDDDSGGNKGALIEDLVLDSGGSHYLWVSSVFAGGSGEYEISYSSEEATPSEASVAAGETELVPNESSAAEGISISFSEEAAGAGAGVDDGLGGLSGVFSGAAAAANKEFNVSICKESTTGILAKVKVCSQEEEKRTGDVLLTGPAGFTFSPQGMNAQQGKLPYEILEGEDCVTVSPFTITATAAAAAAHTITAVVVGLGSDTGTFNVVKVESVTVISGATQVNVTGAKNWAAVKDAGDIVVQATLTPNTDAAASAITWTGGAAVTDKPRQRKVSKAASAKTNVKAECVSTSSADLDAWVIWAGLEVKKGAADTVDAGNDATFLAAGNWPASFGGGNKLGEITKETTTLNYAYTAGKIQAKATLEPAGVEDVVKTTWHMKRTVTHKGWDNGGHYVPVNCGGTWTAGPSSQGIGADDTSEGFAVDENPSSGSSTREIYDLDAPGCSVVLTGTAICRTSELYANFTQYVTVTLDADYNASDNKLWSYAARVDTDKPNNKVELNELKLSHITIANAPHYAKR